MESLLWPGSERAGDLATDWVVVTAMVAVESAWLDALVQCGAATPGAAAALDGLVTRSDLPGLSREAENGGNPVIPLVALLRDRLEASHLEAAEWLHRGLTSQDVLDSSLMLCASQAVLVIVAALDRQVIALVDLVDEHRGTPMVGRTLTQHAAPVTFGLKASTWLQGILDVRDDLVALRFPAQIGGAVGSLAAPTILSGTDRGAIDLATTTAATLGLAVAPPWHTNRTPVTRIGDALVRCTDAWGHLAADVLIGSRPEIGELSESDLDGHGSSSTMPHKRNPVLSVLIRRAALAAPAQGASLHIASANAVDERPDGGWHVEWATLATLLRRTAIAASQTTELVEGLQIHTDRMASTLATSEGTNSEQRTMSNLAHREATTYWGAVDLLVDSILDRARSRPEATS